MCVGGGGGGRWGVWGHTLDEDSSLQSPSFFTGPGVTNFKYRETKYRCVCSLFELSLETCIVFVGRAQ